MGTGYVNLSGDTKRTLQDIACLAYGSGKYEGRLGGHGRMGIFTTSDGKRRVVKFNTHWYERLAHVSTADRTRMEAGSNSLRAELLEIAKSSCGNSREGREKLNRIKVALGYRDADGYRTTPKGLLNRQIVASVLTEIGGDELWDDALKGKGDMRFYASSGQNKRTRFDTVLSARTDTPHATEVKEIRSCSWNDFETKFREKAQEILAQKNPDALGKVKGFLQNPEFQNTVNNVLLREMMSGVMSKDEWAGKLEGHIAWCLKNVEKTSALGLGHLVTQKNVSDLLCASGKCLDRFNYSASRSDVESLETLGLTCDEFNAAVKDCANRFCLNKALVGNCILKYVTAAVQAGSLKAGDGPGVLEQIKSGACEAVRLVSISEGRELPASAEGQPSLLSGKTHKALLAGLPRETLIRLAGFLPALAESGAGPLSPIVLGGLLKANEDLFRLQSENGRLGFDDIYGVLSGLREPEGGWDLEKAVVARAMGVGRGDVKRETVEELSEWVQTYGVYPDEAAEILSGHGSEKLQDQMEEEFRELVRTGKVRTEDETLSLSNLKANLPKLLASYAWVSYGGTRTEVGCKQALEQILRRPEMRERRLEIMNELHQIEPGDFEAKLDRARRGDPEDGAGQRFLRMISRYSKGNSERMAIANEVSMALDDDEFGWMKDLMKGDPLLSAGEGNGCPPKVFLVDPKHEPFDGEPGYLRYRLAMLNAVQNALREKVITKDDVTGETLGQMLRGDFSSLKDKGEAQRTMLDRASAAIVAAMKEGIRYHEDDRVFDTAGKTDGLKMPGNVQQEWFSRLLTAHIRNALKSSGGFKDAFDLNDFVRGVFKGKAAFSILRKLDANLTKDEIDELCESGLDVAEILKSDKSFGTPIGIFMLQNIVKDLKNDAKDLEGREAEVIERLKTAFDGYDKLFDDDGLFADNEQFTTHAKIEQVKTTYGKAIYGLLRKTHPNWGNDEIGKRFVAICTVFEKAIGYLAQQTGRTDIDTLRKDLANRFDVSDNFNALAGAIEKLNGDKADEELLKKLKGRVDELKEVDDLIGKLASTLEGTSASRPNLADLLRKTFGFEDVASVFLKQPIVEGIKNVTCDATKLKDRLNTRINVITPYVKKKLNENSNDPVRRMACETVMNLLRVWPLKMLSKKETVDQLVDGLATRYGELGIDERMARFRATLENQKATDEDKAKAALDLIFSIAFIQVALGDEYLELVKEECGGDYSVEERTDFMDELVRRVLDENADVRDAVDDVIGRIRDSGEDKLRELLNDWAKGVPESYQAIYHKANPAEGSSLATRLHECFLASVARLDEKNLIPSRVYIAVGWPGSGQEVKENKQEAN